MRYVGVRPAARVATASWSNRKKSTLYNLNLPVEQNESVSVLNAP
jgi:hypothetical protein